jgi:hypothetical protein
MSSPASTVPPATDTELAEMARLLEANNDLILEIAKRVEIRAVISDEIVLTDTQRRYLRAHIAQIELLRAIARGDSVQVLHELVNELGAARRSGN